MINKFFLGMIAFAMTFLSGCSYSDYTPTLEIGGTVSGLPKSVDVVLMNNGDRVNTIYAENGEFTFKTQVAYGASYKVEILTQPGAFKWCYVANGSGQVIADVTNISVVCEDAKVEVTNILSPGVSTDISGLAVSPSGEVFVSQRTGRNISKVEALNALTPYATNLLNPHDIVFDETGNIYYLGNTDESVIYTLDKNKAETRFGVMGPSLSWKYVLNGARGLQIDRTTGKFYLTSGTQGLVDSYDPKTKEEKAYEITIYSPQNVAIPYNHEGYLSLSSSVATDKLGNIYTADLDFIGVSKIDKAGVSRNYAGFFQKSENGIVRNGTGSEATFTSPQGITSDRSGYVYVVDPGTMVIRQIAPSDADPNVGTVTTLKTNGVDISLGQYRVIAPPHIVTMRITTGFDGALYTLDQTTGEIKRIRAVAPR